MDLASKPWREHDGLTLDAQADPRHRMGPGSMQHCLGIIQGRCHPSECLPGTVGLLQRRSGQTLRRIGIEGRPSEKGCRHH